MSGCTRPDTGSATPDASPSGRTFPPGFIWGVATSAYQIEGAVREDGRGPSIWDTFSHTPGRVKDGSTGDIACDHYHRYAADLDLMNSLNVQSYRFSLSWPRILPQGTGPPNAKGLDFYKRLLDGLHQRGIVPMATLFHWDLPQALQDRGGWENRDCASWFADYARVVFDALGDAVPTWLTINEPKTIVQSGYQAGAMAPGKRDPVAAVVAQHHLALGHGLAVQAYRAVARHGRIGPALNLAPAYVGDTTVEARQAAQLVDGTENRAYLNPIFLGSYPSDVLASLRPDARTALERATRPGDLKTISTRVDLLGVNYYGPTYVSGTGARVTVRPTSVAGWEQIYPDALTDLLVRLKRDYGDVPLTITENGVPDPGGVPVSGGTVADQHRIDYLRDHLTAAHRAIEQGVRLEGYHLWSLLDNFEWAQGYTQRWGIVYVDFPTQRRIPKQSAGWYRGVISRNGV
ncbi:MAG TPA: GH1 family beta-glucosidase [Rugosimonospora sp.]|nr:GH1 family beta-glucosidase [Rugosimonospora sp.]